MGAGGEMPLETRPETIAPEVLPLAGRWTCGRVSAGRAPRATTAAAPAERIGATRGLSSNPAASGVSEPMGQGLPPLTGPMRVLVPDAGLRGMDRAAQSPGFGKSSGWCSVRGSPNGTPPRLDRDPGRGVP
ncbi:hypothetical protein Ssi03_03120 [Sphaerisporangium siamense]|nr:hypothetical protein Ssi03_03120 [Sphaerisporangium siamense]